MGPSIAAMFAGPLLAAALAGSALADCKPPAAPIAQVEGVVREAADGAALCVQTSADDARLTRVRLTDVLAPPLPSPGGEGAKWALRRVARNRRVACRMDAREPGAGVCTIGGITIGALLSARR